MFETMSRTWTWTWTRADRTLKPSRRGEGTGSIEAPTDCWGTVLPPGRRATAGELPLLLRRFRRARGGSESEQALERVLESVAPEVRAFLRRRLRVRGDFLENAATQAEQDAAELYCGILGIVGAELRRARNGERPPLERPAAYARRVAAAEFSRYLRERNPERARLRDRLADLLDGRTTQKGFARWCAADGDLLCGFAAWQAARAPERQAALRCRQLAEEPAPASPALREALESPNPAALVAALLDWLGGPVPFDEFVELFAALVAARSGAPWAVTLLPEGLEELHAPDPRPDPAAEAEWRAGLQWLWEEIGRLTVDQRRAFLLGGRNAEAAEELRWNRIASLRELAAALDLPAESLAALWDRIPLPDAEIARLFSWRNGQEVINRRDDARKHLARRMGLAPPSRSRRVAGSGGRAGEQ